MTGGDQGDTGNSAGNAGSIQLMVAISVLALVLAGCALVLLPFVTAILWAVILSYSTWGIFCQVRGILGGRSLIAALVMTLTLAAIVVAPFVIVGSSLADNVSAVVQAIRSSLEQGPWQPPAWVDAIPVAGPHLHDYLNRLATDKTVRANALHELILPLRDFALSLGKALGHGVVEISLSLLVCFFLYRDGEAAAARLQTAAFRVAGERGRQLLEVARLTVKGVVQGILGTSLIQGVLGGVGFWIAGVPGAVLLGFATFILSLIPMAAALLWIPAAVWLYEQGATGWAIFLVVWSAVVGSLIEHVLKPIIISRTGGTPFLIVLFGVLGGALAFGFIGVFIGPTLLAVGYGLIDQWSEHLSG